MSKIKSGTPVRIARDLNRSGLWSVYAREGGRWRCVVKTESLTLSNVTWNVSASGIERIRTPKGQKTKSGAQGLGKRALIAYACGTLDRLDAKPSGGPRITFNPFKNDGFMLDGKPAPAKVARLVFTAGGVVEVKK